MGNQNSTLLTAARDGNLLKVKQLLEKPGEVEINWQGQASHCLRHMQAVISKCVRIHKHHVFCEYTCINKVLHDSLAPIALMSSSNLAQA